jgi:hypothetical protein
VTELIKENDMRGDKRQNIIDVLYYSPRGIMDGLTSYEIAKKIGASPQYTNRVLKSLFSLGMIAFMETPYNNTVRRYWTTTNRAKSINKKWSGKWTINPNVTRQLELPM